MDIAHFYQDNEEELPQEERLKIAAAMNLMLQGKEEAKAFFVATFVEDDLKEDFPLIARDFLSHVQGGLKDYVNALYGDDDIYLMAPTKSLYRKILNAMLDAASKGDEYTIELFREMHKTYFREEYRALRRFRTISYREIEGFENELEPFEWTAARILVLCPFYGIEIQGDCLVAYGQIHDFWNDELTGLQPRTGEVQFAEGLFQESLEHADRIFHPRDRKNMKTYSHYRRFIEKALEYEGFSVGWDSEASFLPGGHRRGLAVVRSLLKTMYPNRDFTDDELQLYLCIYELLYEFTDQATEMETALDIMLGREIGDEIMEEASFWKGIREPAPSKNAQKPRKEPPKSTAALPVNASAGKSATEAADRQALIQENESLRASLRMKEQNLKDARLLYKEAQKQLKQNQEELERASEERRELIALRDFAFHLTEEDLPVKEAEEAVMEAAIRKKRILIVGGHGNWTSQLKEKFPGWSFIKPGISGTVDVIKAATADHVFFFTDTISHSTYGKFIHAVREQHIPFGYIHQTNIRANIRQIYAETEEVGQKNRF